MSEQNTKRTRTAFALAPLAMALVIAVGEPAQAQFVDGSRYGAEANENGERFSGGAGADVADLSVTRQSVTGMAQANITAGLLRAGVSTAERGRDGCHPFFCNYGANMGARMWDTITINNTTANAKVIPYDFAIDGILNQGPWGSAAASARLYFGKENNKYLHQPYTLGDGEVSYSGQYTVSANSSSVFYFYTDIQTSAYRGGIADFSHTLRFDWTLPEGVTYRSASGKFMTGATTAVPEPGTWAMLIGGFGLIGGTLRRRGSVRQITC
jgi:hypothetical protein